MDFTEAEVKFNELQARVQRGEPLSEDQYQEELAKLMVQDDHGTFWSLEPGTGRWLYFDGTEWVPGVPPRPGARVTPLPPPPSHAEPEPMPTSASAGSEVAAATAAGAYEAAHHEAEAVPPFIRETATEEPAPERPGGIAPRPVRESAYSMGMDERPWLPFAIGAVVLLLCAVVLFFGVRNAPFFGAASAKATATESPTNEPTSTAEMPAEVTDTPAPTATKGATPTPKTITATTTDKVRVRGGPGTSYPVLTTVADGTVLTAVGRNADNSWIQVLIPGSTNTGWVSADYVTVSDINALPVVQAPGTKATAVPTKKPAKPAPTATPKP